MHACRVLQKYQSQVCCFNDDIQGTACIVLAGILSALRSTGSELSSQTFLFLGAGEAGVGIAELIAAAICKQTGCRLDDARKRCLFMDSKVLVHCRGRLLPSYFRATNSQTTFFLKHAPCTFCSHLLRFSLCVAHGVAAAITCISLLVVLKMK